jgi:hypothetical protein
MSSCKTSMPLDAEIWKIKFFYRPQDLQKEADKLIIYTVN